MKTKIINFSDIANHPNISLSARDYLYDRKFVETVKIKQQEADRLQRLLDLYDNIDFKAENVEEDAVLARFSIKFEDGKHSHIEVCSGQTNCYTNPVLFDKDGNELTFLEPDDSLLGEYVFHNNESIYILNLEVGDN